MNQFGVMENTPSALASSGLSERCSDGGILHGFVNYPMAGIVRPGPNDVLCGRGGGTNNHCGNVNFRKLVNEHKIRYLAATKVEKPKVAREVVHLWRNMNPPGRFLTRTDGKASHITGACLKEETGIWADVGDKKAREKASQCLRERTPDVMPFVKQMQSEQASQSPEEQPPKKPVKKSSKPTKKPSQPAVLSRSKTAPAEVVSGPGGKDSFPPPSPQGIDSWNNHHPGHLQVHQKVQRSQSVDPTMVPFQMQQPRHPGQNINPSTLRSSFSVMPQQMLPPPQHAMRFPQQQVMQLQPQQQTMHFPCQKEMPPPPTQQSIEVQHRQQQMPPPPTPPGGWSLQQPAEVISNFSNFRDACQTVQEGNEDDDTNSDGDITLEEYQQSLEAYLAKEMPPDADEEAKLNSRRQIMEGMRQNSWIKSFYSIGASEADDSCGTFNAVIKKEENSDEPKPNLTLSNPIPTTSSSVDNLNMPPPVSGRPSRPSMPNKRDPFSRSQKMKFAKYTKQGKSDFSMFSDVTDLSFNPGKSTRSMKMAMAGRLNSNMSMMSELTDLSESMNAMDLSISKAADFGL